MWLLNIIFEKSFLLPQTLMSWNSLVFAHYVGCVNKATLTGLPDALPKHKWQGLEHSIVCSGMSMHKLRT
jgi:hypothetical protein